MPPPVLVLDLDGTLLDARARQVHTLVLACAASGEAPIDGQRFWNLKRAGSTTFEALGQIGLSVERARRLAEWWREHVEKPEMLVLDEVLPRARQAIEACHLHGHAPRILTARSDAASALRQLDECGLRSLVDDVRVVLPSEASIRKSEILREWKAAAMIGDTESDAKAAALASTPFLAVSSGQRDAPFLRARSALVFDDVLEAVDHWFARNSRG